MYASLSVCLSDICFKLNTSCLILSHCLIFQLYCYNRLVEVLLHMLRQTYNDDFLLRIGIFLLNSLACQVEGEHKQILGKMGIVEVEIFINFNIGTSLKVHFRSKSKFYIFICTSQPQHTYKIIPLWNIQTTDLDPIAQ